MWCFHEGFRRIIETASKSLPQASSGKWHNARKRRLEIEVGDLKGGAKKLKQAFRDVRGQKKSMQARLRILQEELDSKKEYKLVSVEEPARWLLL